MGCCNFKRALAIAGPVGSGCGCVGCMGGTAGGVVSWIYLVWPAMISGGLGITGRILITLLGPGEAFLVAWMASGILGLGAIGCGIGALFGCGGGGEKFDFSLGEETAHRTHAQKLDEASQEIKLALEHLKQKLKDGPLDDHTITAEVNTISESLISRNLIKAEERTGFETVVKKIVTNHLTAAEIAVLEERATQGNSHAPSTPLPLPPQRKLSVGSSIFQQPREMQVSSDESISPMQRM